MKGFLDLVGSLIELLFKGVLGLFGEIVDSFFQKDHSLKARFGKASNVLHKKNTGVAIGDTAISLQNSLSGGALILGKTGSGKSSKVFKNQLFRTSKAKTTSDAPSSFSYIILDPAGEILKDCGASLIDKGYEIEIINFVESSGATHSWNPLANLQDHEINRFASEYIEASMKSSGSKSDPFWNISAGRLLAFSIDLLRQFDAHYQTLANARFILEIMAGQPEKIDQLMSLEHIPESLFNQYMAIQNMGEKVLQSVLSTVMASLQHFSDPNIISSTSASTLNMESYRSRSKCLFIQNPVMAQEYVSGLNSLLFSAWFTFSMKSLPQNGENTIIFLVDECSSLAGMKSSLIPLASSMLRKHNAFGIFGYQSFFQVEQLLTHQGAMTLKQNVGSILYLPGQDLQTSKEISERLSKYSYEDKHNGQKERSLLTHDEVTFLRGNNEGGILFSGNERGILLKHIQPFYKIPKYMKWTKEPLPEMTYLQQGSAPLFPIDHYLVNLDNA